MDLDQPNGDATAAVKAEAEEDDEVDPLDAFMAAEVMPEVTKVQQEEQQQQQGLQQQQAVKQEEDAGGTADGPVASQPAGGAGRPSTPDDRKKKAAAARKRVSRYYDSESSSESDEVGRWLGSCLSLISVDSLLYARYVGLPFHVCFKQHASNTDGNFGG
jgi:hypothetical protein